MFAELTRTAP